MAENHGAATERTALLQPDSDPVDGPIAAPNDDDGAVGRDGISAESISRLRGLSIFIVIGLLIFLMSSNISLMTTTQGFIAEDLDAFKSTSWFTSAYLIAVSSLTPLGGRICKITSPRAYISFSTIVFSVGAIVTASAESLAVFLTGRVITGLGSAGVYSVAMILVLQLSSAKRRGLFIGLLNSGFTVGVSLGAIIAGAVVKPLGWRIIFWVQAPLACVCGLGIFFASSTLPVASPEGGRKEPLREQLAKIDYLGASFWVCTIVLFLYGMSGSKILPIPIIISLGTFAVFVMVEARFAVEPVIPVVILRSKGTFFSCMAQVSLMIARWAILFYTPVYTIAVRSWTQAEAGLILLPTNLGFGIGGLIVGALHIRHTGSFYISCVVSFALFALTLLAVAQISTQESSAVVYMIGLFVNGLVTGAILNYTMAHLLYLTSTDTHTIVTPLLATFRGFAGSFGSAIGGGIFTRTLKGALERGFADSGLKNRDDLIRRLLGSPALAASLKDADRNVAVHAFEYSLKMLFTAGAILAVVATILQAGTGWKGPGHKREDPERSQEEHHRVS
ncbi:MAG: hypothetical protein M1820_010335 [Bogoriella megaspora]|nr:MAG: hypothetical protein M1820_010335 [Bogoriella megaspora]